jgi:hypothetical protein
VAAGRASHCCRSLNLIGLLNGWCTAVSGAVSQMRCVGRGHCEQVSCPRLQVTYCGGGRCPYGNVAAPRACAPHPRQAACPCTHTQSSASINAWLVRFPGLSTTQIPLKRNKNVVFELCKGLQGVPVRPHGKMELLCWAMISTLFEV